MQKDFIQFMKKVLLKIKYAENGLGSFIQFPINRILLMKGDQFPGRL